MKIQELRNKLSSASREDVEVIAAELYKMLPKAKKESDADEVIESVLAHKDIKKTGRSKNDVVDLIVLKSEIEIFLSNVDNNYYIEPNRIVPKNKRSKWRFEVKNYVKQLDKIPLEGEDAIDAARLMRELYRRLCYGCGYYIFPTEDPFSSVGIAQVEFYGRVIIRSFAIGIDDERLKNALLDATAVFPDRETLNDYLEKVLISNLPTTDSQYRTIEIAMKMVDELEGDYKRSGEYSTERYRIKDNIENLCVTILGIGISLGAPEDAIKYFWLHDKDDKEITLFKLLRSISYFDGDEELWKKTYEDAVNERKVKPRKSIEDHYKDIS